MYRFPSQDVAFDVRGCDPASGRAAAHPAHVSKLARSEITRRGFVVPNIRYCVNVWKKVLRR